MANGDEDALVLFDAASGNASDKERSAHPIRRFRDLTNLKVLFVADSTLYSEENLNARSGLRWVTRAPLSLKDAKRVPDDSVTKDELPVANEDRQVVERGSASCATPCSSRRARSSKPRRG